jgi:site-specific DNA recombinase
MRVAIYARFSSDLQSAASVDDQFSVCVEHAEREGWQIVERLADHGMSGASLIRPGIQQLLHGALLGSFEVVLAEALDRVSRDQEDIAAVYKRLTFAGVRIVTLAEGTISELHIGLKGTMNALFLKDLADKTRRGLRGRVQAGKSGGGLCYGYDVVRQVDARGEAIRGDRQINDAQASIVRRVFENYANGISPRVIAKALNSEAVAGPTGSTWGPSTIHGNKERGTGLLNNELYIGRLVWNRQRFVKDPMSGKRQARPNAPEAWIIQQVPHLRVIHDDLWARVKARQDDTALGKRDRENGAGFWDRRRPKFLLSGLVKCGVCGSGFVKISEHHFGCSSARNKGTCVNTRGIRMDSLEAAVLAGLQSQLMDDELIEVFCDEYTRHLNQLRMEATGSRSSDEARLVKITRELDRLVEAIVQGVPAGRIREKMKALDHERTTLEAKLATQPGKIPPLLHPKMGDVYRNSVAELRQSLASNPDRAEAVDHIRALIERIVLHPAPEEAIGFVMDIEGDLAGILTLSQKSKKAAELTPDDLVQIKLVAGTGFEPVTFRL